MEHTLIDAAAYVFNGLQPAILILIMLTLGMMMFRYAIRIVRDSVGHDYIDDYSETQEFEKAKRTYQEIEKPKNGDQLWPEKPKNDFVVGIGDDGELVYGDQDQGES